MRAVEFRGFGDPSEVAVYCDAPEPNDPGPGEVMLGVAFSPVNINDLLLMSGKLPIKPTLPRFAGNEAAGVILAIGPGVTNVKVGDRAAAPLYSGTWRERMLIPSDGLFALPRDADLKQLAMMRINPLTAALIMSEFVDLRPGDWVVQNAANSGVGRAVIAIAKAHGHKTINIVRRAEQIAELEAAGGDIVIVDHPEAPGQVLAAVGPQTIRLAIDGVSGPATGRLVDYLSPGGTLVGYARMSGEVSAPADLRACMSKGITLTSFYMGMPRYASKIASLLPHAARMIASGEIGVPIAAVYPLSEVREAIAHVQRGGKVMLQIAAEP